MPHQIDPDIIDELISFLDMFTILLVEDDPVTAIVLAALLKIVTKDRILRI
jgi:hypothetical protein